MKKLKIKRKAYADGTPAVGVVGDEDMSASSLRGDDLSAWNAAQTQAEKDKILADANAKKTAKNNATMAAVGNTLNAGSKALGKGDQHTTDVEQGVDVVQDTVASAVPVAGLFHGISEMGQSIGAEVDPDNADKQKYFFEPHRLITDGLIGGEFFGTADWQVAEKKKKQEEGIAQSLRAQSDVNYVPKMKEGGEVTFKGDKEKTVLMLPDGTKSTYADYQKKSGYNDSVIINNFKLENKLPAQMAVGKMEQENRPIVNEAKPKSQEKLYTFKVRATDKEDNPISEWHKPGEKPQQVLKYKSTLTPMFKTITKAEGGEVSGAGGPKDDKVKMNLQERSFVVPAENADKAEELRKKHLGKTTKKMKSGGDVPVKLSDGEHVFTPEERDVLERNGVDLTALAPNATDDFNLKHGGSVPKGYAGGGAVKPKKSDTKVVYYYPDGTIASGYTKDELKTEAPDAIYIGEVGSIEAQKFIDAYGQGQGKAPMTVDERKVFQQELKDAGFYDGEIDGDFGPKTNAAAEERAAATQGQNLPVLANSNNTTKPFQITPPTQSVTPTPLSPITNTSQLPPEEDTEKKNKLLKVSDALGGATGALALAQVGLGLGQTLSGKRPKFKVDSEFLGRVGDALKSEKSGLPEATKTAALNKLGLGRKALTNYATSISGGNTGTAFAAAKEAAGQEAAGIVELASRDAMMQLQKKSRTDSLVSHLQGLKRQAFEDDLNAFTQNQNAGAQLTQAGISNFVGNKQYKDAQDRMDARLAKYGTTGLTTTV